MIIDMPRKALPYLLKERTRHGTAVYYFRRGKGPRTRLKGQYGSKDFMAAYEAALVGSPIEPKASHPHLTLPWCIEQFMASPAWNRLAPESRKQMSYQFERIATNAAGHLITAVRRKDVIAGRDRRAAVPSDANKYVRAMSMLCQYAVDQEWIAASPVFKISKLATSKTGEGFHTWTDDEMAAFEQKWPIGTMQRLAYEIMRCTALRRGDVRRFGPQHVRRGEYSFRTSKTGSLVEGSILPQLSKAISATKVGDMAFLLTSHGIPFQSAASFGNWFKNACVMAGVPGSAHGLRKATSVEAAENGATEAQINAMLGHAIGSKEGAVYVAKANRKKLSKQVGNIIARTRIKGAGRNPAND